MTFSENRLAYTDAADWFSWPLAEAYEIIEGEIRPVGPFQGTTRTALQDRDLFGSFARPWAVGAPSENKILRWVGKYGLFTAPEVMLPLREHGIVAIGARPGDPLPMAMFLEESRQAYDALTLFEAVNGGRYATIRSRVTTERMSPPAGPPGRFADTYVRFGDTNLNALHVVEADEELDGETLLSVGVSALEQLLSGKLKGGGDLRFGMDLGHKRPLSEFGRPVLVWVPSDLKAALWFQLAQDVADARRWKLCAGCGLPFPVRRATQECCAGSPSCRKKKERKKTDTS